MKGIFAFFVLFLMVISISPLVSADIGPKPTVNIDILYDGNSIQDASFSAKMLDCNYQMKYEQIISELAPYENTDEWYDRCQYVSLDYGFDKRICYGELQSQRGMTNLSYDDFCRSDNIEYCEKVILKIPDYQKGCYWTPAFSAWGGDCENSQCDFSYFPPSEFRLAVYIPSLDKVFVSNEISRTSFNSNYLAELRPEGTARIYETTPLLREDNVISFIWSLAITLMIELLVALVYLSVAGLPKKILTSVLVANLITLPVVWFVVPLIGIAILVIALSEIFAVVFEAYFIYYLNKKAISLKRSFVLSIIMNVVSFIVGGSILFILQMLFFI